MDLFPHQIEVPTFYTNYFFPVQISKQVRKCSMFNGIKVTFFYRIDLLKIGYELIILFRLFGTSKIQFLYNGQQNRFPAIKYCEPKVNMFGERVMFAFTEAQLN